MVVIVISIVFFLYVCLILLLITGWLNAIRHPAYDLTTLPEKPMVSIIVAARNEKGTIEDLLGDLAAQVYSPFEVIVVDDHSEDGMSEGIVSVTDKDPRFKLLHGVGYGKKQAITRGIEAASGSIIMTTDADCRVKTNWIGAMISHFANAETQFVFGGVSMQGVTWFATLQSIEFAALIATGAATAAVGYPTMCNGANLAFRTTAFKDVNGYAGNADVPSGDDEFLMRKIVDKYPNSIKFATSSESVVLTNANANLGALFHQRIRWAGKWRHQTHMVPRTLALFVFCFHVVTTALIPLVLLDVMSLPLAVVMVAVKCIIELIFLRLATPFLKVAWRWPAFLMLQFLYSPYVIIVAVLSSFRGYVWKGRKLKPLTVSSN